MNWRGTTTVRDRIFACLPYLIPLIEGLLFAVMFNVSIFTLFPILAVIFQPLFPLLVLYTSFNGFASLIIFFALFMLVVRNDNVAHFIRFNTMQALLLDIALFLGRLLLSILNSIPSLTFIVQVIANAIFLGLLAAVIYCVVQSLRGHYAEIPTLSDAVYMQVR